MTPNLPSFLFAGTAKSGTTSIYHYLRQHPDVAIPMKETFYFLRDVYSNIHLPYPAQRHPEDLVLNHADYFGLYQNLSEKVTGEIGTGYLYHHKESIPLIREVLGKDLKILIILRNPADRCFSSYMHFVKDLHEPLSFTDSLLEEAQRKKDGWDFMWMHKDLGFYAEQVKAFKDAFVNVKVIIYEEFIMNPEEGMNEIFEFIGVSPLQTMAAEKIFNPSGEARFKALQKFITHENWLKKAVRPVFRLFFSKEKREKIRKNAKAKNLTKGQKLNPEVRKRLMAEYMSDILQLESILNRDLGIWYNR